MVSDEGNGGEKSAVEDGAQGAPSGWKEQYHDLVRSSWLN
jgi:hypothetical protein